MPKICVTGYPCGKSCINKRRKCRSNITDANGRKVAETFQQFINRVAGIRQLTPKEASQLINPEKKVLSDKIKDNFSGNDRSLKFADDLNKIAKGSSSQESLKKINDQKAVFETSLDVWQDILKGKPTDGKIQDRVASIKEKLGIIEEVLEINNQVLAA